MQPIGIERATMQVAQEPQRRLQHLRHCVECEHVEHEGWLDDLGLLMLQEVACLEAQGRVVVRDGAEDVDLPKAAVKGQLCTRCIDEPELAVGEH